MISILMPLYNGIEFLNDSISSIINQTYLDWELLIGINGHTKLDCLDISNLIKKYNDNRIKIISCPFKGKTKTLNMLVRHAYYNYICLIDVDDCWVSEKLNKQLPYMEHYDVVGSDGAYFGDRVGTPELFLGKLNPKMFTYQNPLINSAVMMKKDCANWDEAWEGLDDYNLWIHLLNSNKTFYNVSEVLINHRIHSRSCYNKVNTAMSRKLLDEKIQKINEEDYIELGRIRDNKKWEL